MNPSSLPGIATEENLKLRFSPSLIRAVANEAMGREDVLPFWFGESDQPTPSFIREAAIASLREGETFYSKIWAGRTCVKPSLPISRTFTDRPSARIVSR